MRQSTEVKPVDVLAIGAHPDDIELGCGGTLLKLRSLGHRAGAVDLTRGELGSRGTPEIRAKEALEAARILGLEFRVNLELEDGHLTLDRDVRLAVVKIIRSARPKLVITHSPTGHPDHWTAHNLVLEAAHHAGLAKIETGQERVRPNQVAFWLQYSQNAAPHVAVDISAFYDDKEAAIQAYASQLHQPGSPQPETYLSTPEFLEQIRSHHRHVGNLSGCRFAEGFLLARLAKIEDLSSC